MHIQEPKKIKTIISLLAFLTLLTLFVIPTFTLAPTSGRNQSVATRGMPPAPPIPSEQVQFAQGSQLLAQQQERARALFDIQIQSLIREPSVMPFIAMLAGVLAGILSYVLYTWKIRDYLRRTIRRFREKPPSIS